MNTTRHSTMSNSHCSSHRAFSTDSSSFIHLNGKARITPSTYPFGTKPLYFIHMKDTPKQVIHKLTEQNLSLNKLFDYINLFCSRDYLIYLSMSFNSYLFVILFFSSSSLHNGWWVKSFTIFLYIQVCGAYIIWVKPWEVPTVVDSIMILSRLILFSLLNSRCDVKSA